MARLTLSDIRARSTGYFFSRDTMRHFRGSKYKVRYDQETDTNYIVVITPRQHPFDGRVVWYKFKPDGDIDYVRPDDVPWMVRRKDEPLLHGKATRKPPAKRSTKPRKSSKKTPANFGGINLKRVF